MAEELPIYKDELVFDPSYFRIQKRFTPGYSMFISGENSLIKKKINEKIALNSNIIEYYLLPVNDAGKNKYSFMIEVYKKEPFGLYDKSAHFYQMVSRKDAKKLTSIVNDFIKQQKKAKRKEEKRIKKENNELRFSDPYANQLTADKK